MSVGEVTMYRRNSEPDVDSLRVELRRKEHDLMLAARFGKNLLEENTQLKNQLHLLREEHAKLQESLESQRHEYQRSLNVMRDTAEMHISELEQQLKSTSRQLEQEKLQTRNSKEEHRKRVEGLQVENAQIQAELEQALQEKQREAEIQLELKRSVEEYEREKHKYNNDVLELQKELQNLRDNNRNLGLDVSTLAHTCDQLSDELQTSQEDSTFWENQYATKNGEVVKQLKELQDSQELVKQLQIQLDEQSTMLTPSSNASGLSLYNELLSPNFSIIPEDLSNCSTPSDTEVPDDVAALQCQLRSALETPALVAPETTSPFMGSEGFTCPSCRCQELEEQLGRQEEELKSVSEQLLMAVQQKFKLQQQIEAWQTDMTLVVEQQVRGQLKQEYAESVRRTSNATDTKNNSDICTPTHSVMFQLLRDSSVY